MPLPKQESGMFMKQVKFLFRSVKLMLGWAVIIIAFNYKDEAPVKKAMG